MSSAACFTNRRRVIAEASLLKVQYPGKIASENPLLPVQNCRPDFSVLTYVDNIPCKKYYPADRLQVAVYDGGNYSTSASDVLEGGNYATESTTILEGNA